MADPVRAPRLLALFDGVPVPHAMEARVTATDYFSADWFHAGFAIASDGPDGPAFWASVGQPVVDLRISLDGGSTYVTLIVGKADTVTLDPLNRIARLEGRDLSSGLLDARPYQAYPGQTASGIVAAIAARHGLEARITPTRGLAGRAFASQQQETVLSQHSRVVTDWDMVVRLAQREGYNAYVQGRTLHFEPVDEATGPETPLVSGDFIELRVEHNLREARAADLGMASWNSQASQALGLVRQGAATGDVAIQPNLPATIASAMAREYTKSRRQAVRVLDGTMPGETALAPRSRIRLSGIGAGYDRAYHIETIDRSFSPVTGFRQRIRARQAET